MKKKINELVISNEFNKAEKDILKNLSEILGVKIESLISLLSIFLTGQPLFTLPILAILNPFIKGFASFRDFRDFEMLVSFIDSVEDKTNIEKDKFALRVEKDPEFIKKILSYVIKQNDVLKSKLIGRLLVNYLAGKIDKDEFFSIILIIDKVDWFLILDTSNIIDGLLKSDDHYDFFYSSVKHKSWECLDLKWTSLNEEVFGKNLARFISSGLVNQRLIIQPIPKVLGNSSEDEQIKRLRESLQNVKINFNFSYEGFLIVRFGEIMKIDEKYSFS